MKKALHILVVFLTIISVFLSILLSLEGCRNITPTQLNVYVWEGYLPERAAGLFEQETGIKLNITFISDNDQMHTLLKGGGRADVIMPTDPKIIMFYENDLVQPLDIEKISNFKNVSRSFREQAWTKWDGSQMDSGEIYAIPYIFGTNGLIINTAKYTKNLEGIGWEVLFDPDLKGRVSAKNTYTSVFLILDILGIQKEEFVIDTQGTLDSVRDEAIELKNNVLKFYDTYSESADLLKNEEVWVSVIMDGVGRQLSQFDPKFKFVLPKTGGFGWADTFMIPKNAANPAGANSFIDFMLRPEIAAMVTEQSGFNTTVEGALELTKEIDIELYRFTDEEMANLQWLPSTPEEVVSNFYVFWEELSTVQ